MKSATSKFLKAVPSGLHAYGVVLLARQEKALNKTVRATKRRTMMLLVFAIAYLTGGGAIFAALEDWRYVDGFYFAAVTLTTVGYGDIVPLTGVGRPLAILYCMCGGFFIIGVLLALTVQLRQIATKRTQLLAAKLSATANVRDLLPLRKPSLWVLWRKKHSWRIKLVADFLGLFAFQCGCAGVFMANVDGLTFGNALYHCWVTASTLGYGDFAARMPSTASMRLWMASHVLFSSISFAVTIADVEKARATARAEERRTALLSTKLDRELLNTLDPTGVGVDKLQFVIGMLTSMELVAWSEVEPFLKLFDEMDVDGSGKLDKDDLAILDARKTGTLHARTSHEHDSSRSGQETGVEGQPHLVAKAEPAAEQSAAQMSEPAAHETSANTLPVWEREFGGGRLGAGVGLGLWGFLPKQWDL